MSLTTEQLQRLRTLQGALSALSYEYEDVIPLLQSSVKDGNDTAIGMLKDQTNGLAAIKTQATNAASDAAAAKTAAQGITGYALQGTNSAKTNTQLSSEIADVATLIGYTISEIDGI